MVKNEPPEVAIQFGIIKNLTQGHRYDEIGYKPVQSVGMGRNLYRRYTVSLYAVVICKCILYN